MISYSNVMDHKSDLVDMFFQKILKLPGGFQAQHAVVHEFMGIFVTELIRGLNSLDSLAGTTRMFVFSSVSNATVGTSRSAIA